MPEAITGGPPATARWGSGDAFVVEADEYAGNFDAYRPSVAVLTSAEWDHPDVFADGAAVVAAFEAGSGGCRRARPSSRTSATRASRASSTGLRDWPGTILAYALVDQAPQRLGGYARAIGERFATARGPATAAARPDHRQRPGVDDARAPRPRSARRPGHDPAVHRRPPQRRQRAGGGRCRRPCWAWRRVPCVPGLASFAGIGRRLERKGEVAGVVVYDDYGHHPTAIRETLAAVRQREPGRPVWAVYEPLTFHRTAAMLGTFADVLSAADGVAIADIWAGRDPDTTIASAAGLAAAVAARRPGLTVLAPGSVEATADRLAEEVRPGDVVLVMGGGASYRIGDRLLERLEARG